MRVAIDATSIPPRPAGAGVYAIEIARALAQGDRRDGYALFIRGSWLDDELRARKNWRVEKVHAGSRAGRLAWEQARLPGTLDRLKIDVLHSTHHTLPLRPIQARKVVTIHDVTFLRIPERYPPARRLYMQTLTRLSASAADAIIVPSITVAGDLQRTLRVPQEKVYVVYEAPASRYLPVPPEDASRIAQKWRLERPFVLSVGSLEPGKNRPRLIRAMRRLRDEGVEATLAIVGQRAWMYEAEFRLVDELGMRDHVRFLGYVPDADLPALYAAATAFALPALYEGFGLPVIEAMACGTPVLTSKISATAEVAGDAAILVDPLSLDAIVDGLRRILTNADLRTDLAARGLERAAQFTWARAADQTHDVYEHSLRSGR